MQKSFIALVILFSFFLLLPFSVQTIADLRGEKEFRSLDIFKDIFYSPIVRKNKINQGGSILENAWKNHGVDSTISVLSDLQNVFVNVNDYSTYSSSEVVFKLLKKADSLLVNYDEDLKNETEKLIQEISAICKNYSLVDVFFDVKKYGFWKGEYLRKFENKTEEENVLVQAVRSKYQLFVWNFLDDPGEKVVLGKDPSFLFYRQDVEFLVNPSPLDTRSLHLDNPLQAILKFKEQLQKKGVELLVVIVPGKPSIYPEFLTGKKEKVSSHGKTILDSLTQLGVLTVDLYTPLLNAKKQDAKNDYLYLDKDTHWTPRGAKFVAEVIAQKIRQLEEKNIFDFGENSLNLLEHDTLVLRSGDIADMSGLKVFEQQEVLAHQVLDSLGTPFKDDFRRSKILILGDSFSRIYQTDAPTSAGWISHLSKKLQQPLSSIVSDGGASTLVREKLARRPGVLKGKKLLIWEFVERDLRYGAEGWKAIEF